MLIGIGHRSGHGKDTFANFMEDWLDKHRPNLIIRRINWASKLKEIACDLYGHFGLRDEDFYNTDEGRNLRNVKLPIIDKTPVEIWIDLGEALRDRVYVNTWRDYLTMSIADVVIVADTRKANELEACDVKIKVTNPRVPNREGKSIDHELEYQAYWDYLVYNTKDLNYLQEAANTICERIWNS